MRATTGPLFSTLQNLLSMFMDCFLVPGIMEQMNQMAVVEARAPFPLLSPFQVFVLLSLRSSLVSIPHSVTLSLSPSSLSTSPSYLTACDHFPIMSLKKMNLILKWARIIKSWDPGWWPSWLSDVANEVRLRGMFSHGTVRVLAFFFSSSLFNGFMDSDCTPDFDQLPLTRIQWSNRSVENCVQVHLYYGKPSHAFSPVNIQFSKYRIC